ncbi:lipoate--protein ligase [uncultured Desulfobacter sp.]|uniref:lipoate--protein ligase n=1 Tax=uncultured Desulfobacter sp. TaxID=240139 RepID=UPI0029F51EEA|nr:lipoate--protein ligase [uncultured Desulfobacter sp.]
MRYYLNTQTDPAFNLAAEEYLLKSTNEDCCMLWRNHNTIVVGRNQNTLSQINPEFVQKHDIKVVRRITGGGAVYHDLGNINFTFIKVGEQTKKIDFSAYTRPILEYLNQVSVPARLDGRNDLTVDGLKISGNAQHIHKDRVLHHGTLLFDVNLEMLATVLLVNPEKYRDKAVQSIRSRVTNIRKYLLDHPTVEQFMEDLGRYMQKAYQAVLTRFSDDDLKQINDLAQKRYRQWDWNFGDSPAYDFSRSIRTPGGTIDIRMKVKEGTIQRIRIFGDFFGIDPVSDMEKRLTGCRHDHQSIKKILNAVDIERYIKDVTVDQLLHCMF